MRFLYISLRKKYEYEYDDNPSEPDYYDIRPLRLDPLSSLQRLKIISTDRYREISAFVDELTLMKMILTSSTAPVPIHSIILESSFLEHYQVPSDAILASPIFVDLCTVEVAVTDYPYADYHTVPISYRE